MPLPDHPPVLSSAPRLAGVGLRGQLLRERYHRPPPWWPADWWQRNYDDLYEPYIVGGWIPASTRSFAIPGFPYDPAPAFHEEER